MSYFILTTNDDGEVYIQQAKSEKELSAVLAEKSGQHGEFLQFCTQTPRNQLNEGIAGPLIIKGEIVVPQPVKVVQGWEVPK